MTVSYNRILRVVHLDIRYPESDLTQTFQIKYIARAKNCSFLAHFSNLEATISNNIWKKKACTKVGLTVCISEHLYLIMIMENLSSQNPHRNSKCSEVTSWRKQSFTFITCSWHIFTNSESSNPQIFSRKMSCLL